MEEKQLYLSGFHKDNEPKVNSRHMFILPLDKLILLSVALVLLFILSFSIGVERGKKIASIDLKISKTDINGIEDISQALPPAKIEIKKVQESVELKEQAIQEAAKPEEKDIKRYNIQVASFYKEITANRAVKQLEAEGYPAFISKKGKFVVVYVGEFDNESKAKKILQSLKKQYKDCILRRL